MNFDREQSLSNYVAMLRGERRPGYYGSDIPSSVFQSPQPAVNWGLRDVNSASSRSASHAKKLKAIKGLSGYNYYGAKFTGFPMHTEECDLCSINYLKAGAVKVWFVVAKRDWYRVVSLLQKACQDAGHGEYVSCKAFLRHKTLFATPQYLLQRGIQVYRIVQEPGMYVLLPEGVIHWGYNDDDNLAEAVNFATDNHYLNLDTLRDPNSGILLYEYRNSQSGINPDSDDDDQPVCLLCERTSAAMLNREKWLNYTSYGDRVRIRPGKQAKASNSQKSESDKFHHAKKRSFDDK